MIHVDPELEAQSIKLHFQDGRTQTSLADEFGLSRNVIRRILITYRETTKRDKEEAVRLANMEQLRRLRKENEELKKENDFLKKQRRSSRRKASNSIQIYRPICQALRSQLAFVSLKYLPKCVLQLQEAP